MKLTKVAATVATLALAAVVAPITSANAATTPPVPVTDLTLGAVPSISLGLIELGKVKGSFAKAGLNIKIVPVDSGPNVVVGVVAGQYDLGSTAYAPPLLAYANGSPLRLVTGVDTVGKEGWNGGVLVRKDSGINSWKDLAGKRIASNAPRSLFSLTVPAAIAANGGDASGIKIVPLPFADIAKAVADGKVDAGVALEPFLTKGLADASLKNIGDSVHVVLPEGSGSGVIFTSASTLSTKSAAIAKFRQVYASIVKTANINLDRVKIAGAAPAGLDKTAALQQKLGKFNTAATPESLSPLVSLMVKFGWISKAPDLNAFFNK